MTRNSSLRSNLAFVCLSAKERRDRHATLAMTRNSSLRSNLSFVCLPALNNRDRFVPRDDNVFLAMTEGAPTGEIATFLAMTRNSSLRSNLSFLYLPALNNRDRFVPRDDNVFLAMTELSLAMKSPGERFGPVAAGQFTFEILPNNGKLCYKYLVHSPARTSIIQGAVPG